MLNLWFKTLSSKTNQLIHLFILVHVIYESLCFQMVLTDLTSSLNLLDTPTLAKMCLQFRGKKTLK